MECLGQHLPEAKLTFGMTECTEEIAINPRDQVDKPRGKKKAMKKNHMVRCISFIQKYNISLQMLQRVQNMQNEYAKMCSRIFPCSALNFVRGRSKEL